MRRLFVVVVACLCIGCGSVNQQFVRAMDDTAKAICPEYLKYLRADESLSQESKATRIRTVDLFFSTIEDAKEVDIDE